MAADQDRNSGMPGGGAGRTETPGKSGVYPASGPMPEGNAPLEPMGPWGQGERGAKGAQDHGGSAPTTMDGEKGLTGPDLDASGAPATGGASGGNGQNGGSSGNQGRGG